MESYQIKKNIKRYRPHKKWTQIEIRSILNYLQAVPEIETPTAQIYYKKLLATIGIDASWDLIRWKVRHLKALYKRATDWQTSKDAELLEADSSSSIIEAKTLQMCPHYHQLNAIFGKKERGNYEYVVPDGEEFEVVDESLSDSIIGESLESMYEIIDIKTEQCTNDEAAQVLTSSNTNPNSSANITKTERAYAKSPQERGTLGHFTNFEAERKSMLKVNLEWEQQKYYKEFLLKERKFEIEKEKAKADIEIRKRELDLKELEIKRDETIKILQMEKDERLHRYELELKYKTKCEFWKTMISEL